MDFSKITQPFKESFHKLKSDALKLIEHKKSLSFKEHIGEYNESNFYQGSGALKQAGDTLSSLAKMSFFLQKKMMIDPLQKVSEAIVSKVKGERDFSTSIKLEQQRNSEQAKAIYQSLHKIWNTQTEDLLASGSRKLNAVATKSLSPFLSTSPQERGKAQGRLGFEIASWFVGAGELKTAGKVASVAERGVLAQSNHILEAGLKGLVKTEENFFPSAAHLLTRSLEVKQLGVIERVLAFPETLQKIPLGFRNYEHFREVGNQIYQALGKMGYAESNLYMRGSSVTGKSFTSGKAFDLGRKSDFDFAIAGEKIFEDARRLGLPGPNAKRTWELSKKSLEKMSLEKLWKSLEEDLKRPVSFMIYLSDKAVIERGSNILFPK